MQYRLNETQVVKSEALSAEAPQKVLLTTICRNYLHPLMPQFLADRQAGFPVQLSLP